MPIESKYGWQIQRERWAEKSEFKFGYNPSIGTDEETIWYHGGIYVYPSVAINMKVSSIDDTDISTVKIFGLDANYDQIEETITITGQTAVTTANAFLRIYRARVILNSSAGDIYIGTGTVTSGVPATVYGRISMLDQQTLMSFWTVPRNHTAYIYQLQVNSGTSLANKFVTVRMIVRDFGEVFTTRFIGSIQNSNLTTDFGVPLKIPEKSDIEIRAISSSSTNDCSADFSIIYINEDEVD